MEQNLSREEIIATYKDDVLKLTPYIPWLKAKAGQDVSRNYSDAVNTSVIAFPVFDSQVFQLIKTIEQTKFINYNYVYSYSAYRMRSAEDELAVIPKITTMEIKVLGDILSKYAIKGQTKSALWSEGVNKGVFLAVIERLKVVVDLHDNQII